MSDIEIKTICVLGAGTMGHGIAQVAALAGYKVFLRDISEQLVQKGLDQIRKNLDKGVERGKVSPQEREGAVNRIAGIVDLNVAASEADLVIEAIIENMDLKKQTFAELDEICPPHAILATNTSSLSVTEIASATKRPEKVVGMHFFNPAHIMRLLEVIVAKQTAQTSVDAAVAVGKRMNKEPIVVKDSPGFATSRLGVTFALEAMRMVEEGVATPEDIDKAMELGYNHPMGPFKLGDLVGLDVRLSVAEYLYRELKQEHYRPPEILKRMVREGKLGKKTGEGFYKWDK